MATNLASRRGSQGCASQRCRFKFTKDRPILAMAHAS